MRHIYKTPIYKEVTMIGTELKRGTAELAILSVLERQPLHGYEISRHIEHDSGGTLRFTLAALYPLLYRMEIAVGCVATGKPATPAGVAAATNCCRGAERCWRLFAPSGPTSSAPCAASPG